MKQQSFDWIKWREEGIGSSEAASIMNASPWVSARQLWEIRTGRRDPQPINYPMRRGLALEPLARRCYEEKTGIRVAAGLAIHPKYDFIRGSFDALNESRSHSAELKAPGKADHTLALCNKIPEKYLWQLVHQMAVLQIEETNYFSFYGWQIPKDLIWKRDYLEGLGEHESLIEFLGLGEEDCQILTLRRDRRLEDALLEAEMKFWEFIKRDTPPPENFMKDASKPMLKLVRPEIFKVRKSRPLTSKQAQSLLRQKREAPVLRPEPEAKQLSSVENGSGQYSTREVMEILERAKELGVSSLKLKGLKVTFR